METYKGPFLTNDTLRSVSVIELGDIALAAQEVLATQEMLGGQLVVDAKLRLHLAQGYYRYQREHDGVPPDAIRQPNFPELWFVPLEWQVYRRIPGEQGGMQQMADRIVLFFAVRKRF